ncbi:MAG: BrnA antitoxin family protein [Leptolyngbyaceae cyanobacterium HOT.MB2.61]|nr:BrnA antitoxin family protein [Leptolyngbyaceae cyanobacterium HOT.MB2.61]
MEKKLVSFRLPENLLAELKARAQAEGVSVTELICRFSQQGLHGSLQEAMGNSGADTDIRLALVRLEERVNRLTQLETRLDTFLGTRLIGIHSGTGQGVLHSR